MWDECLNAICKIIWKCKAELFKSWRIEFPKLRVLKMIIKKWRKLSSENILNCSRGKYERSRRCKEIKSFEWGRKVQKVSDEKAKKGEKVIIQLIREYNREYGWFTTDCSIFYYVQIHTHNPQHFTDVFFLYF